MFITFSTAFEKWCTFLMVLEDLILQPVLIAGSSFAGTALYWYIFCPNRGCCQMATVRRCLERTPEEK